jgi:hypothetical protein
MDEAPDVKGNTMKIKTAFALTALVVWACLPGAATGAQKKLSLAQLSPAFTADLRGAKAHFGIKLPIPERWRVTSGTLEVSVVSSVALLEDRSLLSVRLNGHPLSQIKLGSGAGGARRFRVELPPDMLATGYNDLEFVAMHRSTEACQDRGDPELWSTLELDRSALTLEYELRPIPASLGSIPAMVFDPKIPGQARVHLALEDFSPRTLKQAGLAASAAARLYDYRPVSFSVGTGLKKGVDTIAIGSPSFLEEELLRSRVQIEGNLGIMPLPEVRASSDGEAEGPDIVFDEKHALITVQGRDHQERTRAARFLSVLNRPWPGDSFLNIEEVGLPEITRASGRQRLRPGMVTTLEHLGLATTTFKGQDPEPGEASFRLPSQVAVHESKFFTLSLDLVFGARMRQDSVLNVTVNDKFAAAIPLDAPQGARFEDYELQVPVSLLQSGVNTLSFEPVLTPLISGECTLVQDDNLRLTLEGDSTFELPEMGNWVLMPELSLLFQDGFPLTQSPDWKETAVYLPRLDPGTISACLDLIGLICQKTGIGPDELTFVTDLSQVGDRHLLAMGPARSLPAELLQASSLDASLHYPFPAGVPEVTFQELSWWRNTLLKLLGRQAGRTQEPIQDRAPSSQVAARHGLCPQSLLLSEFRSPLETKRTVVMVTARSEADLDSGVKHLLDPGIAAKVQQDLAVLDFRGSKPQVASHQVQEPYSYGKQSPVPVFQDLILESFWTFVLICFLTILAMALILTLLLRSRRKKRLSHG